MKLVEPDSLELRAILRPGDQVVWGQGTGEPLTLTGALVSQRGELRDISVFIGSTFSTTLRPEHADRIRFRSFGAIGTSAALAAAGVLDIVPCHVGQVASYIGQGVLACDVAFVQLSQPGPDGRYSLGVIHDYMGAAIDRARTVVAEINDRVPWTRGTRSIGPEEIDIAIHTSRDVVEVLPARVGEVERAIAGHVAAYIGDGAVLQIGIGSIPDAILHLLGDRKDLGLHSGMAGDAVADLVERGVMTNARKRVFPGVCVAGALIGTKRLYGFAHCNEALLMCDSSVTHGDGVLSGIEGLVSINSAVEVDLTGQVNAELAGEAYVGGTGGQVDYVRAGHRSPAGRSIIAMPSTARCGSVSRIVATLSGPVTTARSEVDVIVTEHGAAELRGCDLRERARRMIAIAHPSFREELERAAHNLFRRGY